LDSAEQRGRNVNSGNYENSRYVIAVAAIDNKGVFAPYSSPGAPLLVSAFGDEPATIATVDRTGQKGYNTKPIDEDGDYINFPDTDCVVYTQYPSCQVDYFLYLVK
jgi:hypothetical protein